MEQICFSIPVTKSSNTDEYALEIDCREHKIIQWYKEHNDDENVNIKKLNVGDFIFLKNKKPMICIERKHITDFASSIQDGRYKTQKFNMNEYAKNNQPKPFLVYLVEGFQVLDDEDLKRKIGRTNISKETILSTITKLMFRDGFQIIFTSDINDTIRWLEKIRGNLYKGEFIDCHIQDKTNQYLDALHVKNNRSSNHLKNISNTGDEHDNIWWLKSLINISGVSASRAHAIVQKYPSITSMIEGYNACKNVNEKRLMLAGIRVNTRRIGKNISSRIYENILGHTPATINKNLGEDSKNPKKPIKDNIDGCIIDSDSDGW